MRKRGVKETWCARKSGDGFGKTIASRLAVLSMVLEIGFLIASAGGTFSPQSKSGGLVSSTLLLISLG